MQDSPRDLGIALESFNRLSAELTAGYRRLERRAARLERQLNSAHRDKMRLADRLSVLLDNLPGAVLVLDEHERVRQANATADNWFGVSTVGRVWNDLVARCSGHTASNAHELRMPEARIVSVCRSKESSRKEIIVLLSDVTLDRQLQAELHRNRRLAAMGEMAARVAHQVRTPLSAALLYVGQLETDDSLSSDVRRPIRKITGQLHKLERMTRDMLAFVRAPHSASATFVLTDLLDEVAVLAEGLRPDGTAFMCVAEVDLATDVLIRGDCQALSGALCNLVENAWLAGALETELKVTADEPGGQFVEFRVTDNGPGIPAAFSERIFEPFFSTRCNGTGLGLPVARSTFEHHGGRLEVGESHSRGTVFVARLPVAERVDRTRPNEVAA